MRPILAIFLLASIGLTQTPTAAPPSAPAITVQALETRLAGLEKGRAQTLANVSAYDGAIEECRYWLNLLKQTGNAPPAPKAAAEKKPPTDKSKSEPGAKPVPKEKSDAVK